jgi:hypothetical protein
MGAMKKKEKVNASTQEEIDQRVVAQAADDYAWDPPIQVQPIALTSLLLPAEVASRAAFIAHLHRKATVEEWLVHIIQERLDFEEAIYGNVKRELIRSNYRFSHEK